ncbi:MAG: hypothetical protein RB292_02815 [Patescibacteria group bacterium]|jgi:hypothetical protein|nr:hypothetical protein [Patescibacteria group bacterium]
MDYPQSKILQFVVEKPSSPKIFVRSFSAKPDLDLENKQGKIFGLIEISAKSPKINELIDLIIEETKDNYYHPSIVANQNLNIGEKFELALKKTNLAIASFIENNNIDFDPAKVNIVLAVVHGQEIHFALVGDVAVILLYSIPPRNYRIIDVLETSKSPSSTPDPLKFFSQIISGRIRLNDIIFIGTSNILDYFSLEKIKNVITQNGTLSGGAELKNLLEQIERQNFGLITLELEKRVATKPRPQTMNFDYTKAASEDSINELIKTEQETQKLLTPSVMPELKKYAQSLNTALKNYLQKAKSSTNSFYQQQKTRTRLIPSPKMNRSDVGVPPTEKKLKISFTKPLDNLNRLRRIFNNIAQPIYLNAKLILKAIGKQKFFNKISIIIGDGYQKLLIKFKKLPPASKTLLVIIVVLAIVLSQSVIWIQLKNKREARIQHFSQIVNEVENLKNDAAASLIYRDEGQARELLVKAKDMLAGLEPANKDEENQLSDVLAGIEEELNNLRYLVEINEPLQVVNFNNLDNQANIANILVLNGNNAYTQNQNNEAIYKANLDTRVLSSIFSPDTKLSKLKLATAINNNEILFFSATMAAFVLSPNDETVKPLTININDNQNIIDSANYNDRLYLLDTNNSQIYRYTKTAGGYTNPTAWIKNSIDLSTATSLTIDGNIYVLKSNGEIIKFENGNQVDFATSLIDPPIQAATKLKTFDNSKFLYFIDPPTKRLIVLNKEGKLINQYISVGFDDLKDFTVRENNKEIYLLNGGKIFGVIANHLE